MKPGAAPYHLERTITNVYDFDMSIEWIPARRPFHMPVVLFAGVNDEFPVIPSSRRRIKGLFKQNRKDAQ